MVAVRTMQTETLAIRMAREGWIIHPQRGKIKFVARPYQRKFWGDRSKRRIICKARQVGMSQAVGAEAVDRAIENLSTILMISRNDDQAKVLLAYCKTVWFNLDDHRGVELASENQRRMTFTNGSSIISLPANKGTGRGWAASHVYIDEAAHAQYAEAIYQAVSPAIASGGTITLLSSPDGPENLFGRIWEGGKMGRGPVRDFDGSPAPDNTWSRHYINWRDNPEYTTENPDWYANERPNHSEDEWQSEFEASMEGSGERVFKPLYLNRMIEGWIGAQGFDENALPDFDEMISDETLSGEVRDGPVVYGDLWYVEPVEGRLYVTAWDLGRKHDPTVGITLDVTEHVHQVVAFERFHNMDWQDQEERIQARYFQYPGWHVIDATGLGDPVYQNLLFAGYDIIPFVFSRTSKPNVIDELVRSTEHEILKLGLATIYDEMHRYRRKDDKLIQDTVMALGMAEYTARHLDLEETYEDDDRVEDVSQAFGRL